MVTAQRETLEEKHAVTLKEAEEMHAAKRQELISQQDAATKSALAEQQRRLEAELGETHAAAIDQLKAEHATVKAEELQVAAHRHAEEQQAEIEVRMFVLSLLYDLKQAMSCCSTAKWAFTGNMRTIAVRSYGQQQKQKPHNYRKNWPRRNRLIALVSKSYKPPKKKVWLQRRRTCRTS